MDFDEGKIGFMREALALALQSAEEGEIPVGAVIERDGVIVGRGRNRTELAKDPTAHAEIEAVRMAARRLGGWRLTGCSMYVTAEPCAMCAGALVLARIDRVFIGTANAKGGACVSLRNLLQDDRLNHRVEMESGLLKDECETVMKEFFIALRKRKGRKADDSGSEDAEVIETLADGSGTEDIEADEALTEGSGTEDTEVIEALADGSGTEDIEADETLAEGSGFEDAEVIETLADGSGFEGAEANEILADGSGFEDAEVNETLPDGSGTEDIEAKETLPEGSGVEDAEVIETLADKAAKGKGRSSRSRRRKKRR